MRERLEDWAPGTGTEMVTQGDWVLEMGTGKVKEEDLGQVMGTGKPREEGWARGTGTGTVTGAGWAEETGWGSSQEDWLLWRCLLPWQGAGNEGPEGCFCLCVCSALNKDLLLG